MTDRTTDRKSPLISVRDIAACGPPPNPAAYTEQEPLSLVALLPRHRLPELAGPGTVHGLRGATAEGGTRDVNHRRLTARPPQGEAP
ncbi:hypothetical protein [Streptomyces sp. SM10]|uniref:hypothetical protein n=1 Tax=Streptomyces sp. SM10 TaxID=565556 RepID=UPI000CDB44C9|nr:hypothetical protein [Streptomyces sp. SM10]